MGLTQLLQWNISLFLLIVSRLTGMIMLAPVFGARSVPMLIKIGVTVSLAIVIYPLIQATKPEIPSELLLYTGILVKEILAGLVMGFIIYTITITLQGAGHLIDTHMGFTMSSAIDPVFGVQSPMMGSFQLVLATMIMLATNAHYYLIVAMVRSYEFVPLNTNGLPNSLNFFIHIVINVFSLSIQLALPIIAVMILTDIGMGLLSKAVPQLNIFSVIFPAKIILGFVILILTISFFGSSVNMLFDKSMTWLFELFKGWQA